MSKRYSPALFIIETLVLVMGLLFLLPFFMILMNSVKPISDIVRNAAEFPKSFQWNNYVLAVREIKMETAFLNSLLITVASIVGMVVLGAMAAWKMARVKTPLSRIMFFLYVAAMVIPFQALMIPLVKVAVVLDIINSRSGLIFIYVGFGLPFTIFLYHGFVKGLPRELEESAMIDGCTQVRIFSMIVFPLLKTITTTVIILQTLWIWNDFLLPALILYKREYHTIPLSINRFFGQYLYQWDKALAALVLSTLPVILFFLALQKNIVKSIAAGALKG